MWCYSIAEVFQIILSSRGGSAMSLPPHRYVHFSCWVFENSSNEDWGGMRDLSPGAERWYTLGTRTVGQKGRMVEPSVAAIHSTAICSICSLSNLYCSDIGKWKREHLLYIYFTPKSPPFPQRTSVSTNCRNAAVSIKTFWFSFKDFYSQHARSEHPFNTLSTVWLYRIQL